jgi:phosphoribosyl 1,2-cyclic phosphodiesterase
MLIRIRGSRGSMPSPGADTVRYGGNTSCVEVVLSDGTHLILDAGTGICNVSMQLEAADRVHILLTHLHLDHIQGLLFFPPLFDSNALVTIWGPPARGVSLKDRVERYLSTPLTPIDVGELGNRVEFRTCPRVEWSIGSARIRAQLVTHPGPTFGFRIEEEDGSLCYLPDHEPAFLGDIEDLEPYRLSGYALAHGADLLIHDCQYTDAEYRGHRGWGHSGTSHAVRFAHRCDARAMLLFHHDPGRSDEQLDALFDDARGRWRQLGRPPDVIATAAEGDEFTIGRRASSERPIDLPAPARRCATSRRRPARAAAAA